VTKTKALSVLPGYLTNLCLFLGIGALAGTTVDLGECICFEKNVNISHLSFFFLSFFLIIIGYLFRGRRLT